MPLTICRIFGFINCSISCQLLVSCKPVASDEYHVVIRYGLLKCDTEFNTPFRELININICSDHFTKRNNRLDNCQVFLIPPLASLFSVGSYGDGIPTESDRADGVV